MNSPVKTIILFFIALILVGTILLCLPFSRHDNVVLSMLTCLFTATSAVCVTGLSVVDIGTYYSTFGQWIILILIQIGALGYMLVSTGIGLLMGKIALKDRKIMQEIFDISSFDELLKLLKKIILISLGIEFIGAVILTFIFIQTFPLGKAIYYAVFHSISAFCNAGFSLFANSLEGFSETPSLLYTIALLIILGGLGFFVLVDVIDKYRGKNIRLTFHSKVVLWMTAGLILFGFCSFFLSEILTLFFENKSIPYIINNSFFHIISARTAGFNSIPAGLITNFGAFVIIVLMFIGGAPGSTAGGVKITTLPLVFVFLRSLLKGNNSYPFAGKNMDYDLIKKSLAIFILMILFVSASVTALLWTEQDFEPIKVMFEAVSACCTVGLSLGITSAVSDLGKMILILSMFIGRVGTVTVLIYFMNIKVMQNNIKYPDAKVLIA